MADMKIDDVVNDSLSSQSSAIQGLNVSETTGVDTSVVNNESNSAKAADLTPKTVTEGVGRTIGESRTIASAVAPEANKFSDAERLGRTIRLNMEGSDVLSRRAKIALEIMDFKQKNPDKPVPDDIDLEITYYRQENQRIAKELAETDPGLLSEGTAAMLSSFRDTAKSAVDHFGKVLSGTAAGAGLGAIGGTVGLPIPLLGTFSGAIGGAVTGAAITTMGVSAFDNIQRMRGETYDELSTVVINNKPANISEESKRNISNAIGVLGGAVEYGLERFALSKIPGVRGLFNPVKVAKEVATNPALAKTLAQFGKGIAANIVGEGAVEGVQYNLDIIAEELGKSWDGSQTSLTKALTNVANRPDYAKGLAKQVTVGAIAGGTGAAALGTPGVIHERVQAQIAQNKKVKSERARAIEQAQAMTEPGDNGVDQTLTPKEITPDAKQIIVDEGQAKFLNSQQSLTLALVLQNTSDAVKDSKVDGQLSTAVELQKKMLEQSGVNQVWVSAEDLNNWADTEKKREKVQKWFGIYDPDLDTRLPVDVGTLSEMIQEDEAFTKMARPTVDDMSFNEMLAYYKDRPERINRDFVAMGVAPAQAPAEVQAEGVGVPLETEQPVTAQLGPSSTDEEILATIGTKQEAYAYLGRLSDEELNLMSNPEGSIERLSQIQQMKDRVTALSEQLPEAEPDLDGTKDVTLDDEVELAFQQFASRPVFTDLIRAGVSPSIVKTLESEYAAIRQDIIQATKDTAYEEMIATASIVDEIKKTEDAIEAIEDSLNDPNIEVVETFMTSLDRLGAEAHVNPETMTPEQRTRYVDDPVLKRRNVFNKYGKLTLNELALQLGVQDGETAMSILRSTPDLEQAFKNAKELTKLAIDTEVLDSVDYNNTAIIKALDKKQKLDAQTFKLLVESAWGKARRGIEGTVFANIDMEKIKQDTAQMIEAIPTGKLNPNVYLRASKRAAIKKVKAALRGDFLEAGRQREIEIRSDEAYKQALITKAKANRMVKKLGRWVRSRAIIQTLKDARLYEAFKDLSKIVNLDPNTPAKLGAFEKVVKKAIEDQTVDMSIPQELVDELDSAATPSELSFEQLSFVYNKHAELIKHAKSDNMIQVEQEKLYVGEVAPVITEELANHPDKDAKKLQRENQVTASAAKRLGAMLRSVALYLPNINFLTMKLAQGKQNSFIRKFIYDQLKGIGSYDNGYGDKATIKERSRLRKAVTALQKLNNRRKRIQGYAQEIISPFQFAESTGLVDSRGEMTKLQLMTAMLFYGTQTGRQRLGNFNVNPETFLEVANEQLTQDDMDFIQSIWDLYDSFKPAIKRMVQEIRGHEVEFVEGAAFEFKGKQYRGGYVPLRYRKKATLSQVTRESNEEMNVALGLEKDIPFSIEAAEAFTKQGNLLSRVKNYDGQLNLDWNYIVTAGFEDILMQTTMHVPILNIMRVLKNQEVGESMASVLGLDEYQELKNHIIGAGRSSISEQLELNSELANNFKFALSKPVTNFVKNTLIGVPSTVLMQLSSGVYAWHSQGIGATPTYIFQIAKLLARPTLLPEAVKLAAELDPSIGTYVENVTEDTRGGIGNIVAKNLYTGSPVIGRLDAKLVNMLNSFDDITTKVFLDGILGNIDMMLKVPAVLTMYERFKAGKVQGFESEVLAKMTPAEIEREARAYTTRTSQGTLTATSNIEKAKAQKVKWLSGWSRYFNDIRNIYNYTMLNTVSKTRWNLTNARKDFANGDTLDGVMKISGAAYGLIAFQMYATVAATIISAARGRGTDEDEEEIMLETMFTHEWEKQIVQTAWNHFTNPLTVPKNVVSALPIVRDMVFSTEVREATGDRVRPIVAPMDVSVINIVVDGYRALQVVWENDGDFTDKQLNTILKGLSPFAPIPYRAIDQYMKSDSFGDKAQEVMNDPAVVLMAPAAVVMIADALIERFKNNGNAAAMEQVQKIKDMVDPNNMTQVQAIAEGSELPLTDYEKNIIMFTESNGNPNAKAKGSGAYGLYQFIPKTWKGLVDQYGDLYGLTEDGLKTSPEQQEIAFRLFTRDNAKILSRAGVEITMESIYAAHHFGAGTAAKILSMPDSAKLPDLDSARSANPWLNGDMSNINDGERVNTVADFKQGLSDLLNEGKRKYIKAMDLD